jgi:iron complex transport system substrate-binding protein
MLRSVLAAVALGCAVAAPAHAAPVNVVDGLRRPVTVNAPVKRVVALSLTTTEILMDIGLPPVGRPITAVFPSSVNRIADVGPAYTPDLEKIVALRPDLLLGSVGTTAARARDLGNLRLPLIVTSDSSLRDVYNTYTLIGQLTGEEGQAKLALSLLQNKVNRVIKQVPASAAKPKVLIILAAGGQSFAATDETYVGDLVDKLGGINIAKGVPSADPRQPGFVSLSLEQIVASGPDLILAFRSRTASGSFAPSPLLALENQPAYQGLAAVKAKRVHLLDADPFVTAPGPRAAESLGKLLPLLYPR